MAPFGGFFEGCPKGQSTCYIHSMRTFHNVNSLTSTCHTDLDDFGDHSGMAACFEELGLDVPTDDAYETFEDSFAISVLDII